ncbi:MAG TPA: multicopper oxidase domain-containing protein [Steroidobacteraceae bacterium]|nr:multicopper oxidase domain-containing protein [Steroidobacteraceae bacterium]
MRRLALLPLLLLATAARAAVPAPAACTQPPPGSTVPEPADLRSRDGVLELDLFARNVPRGSQPARYCFETADGTPAPTLRVRPGDLLVLRLHNELHGGRAGTGHVHGHAAGGAGDPCTSAVMSPLSTNLHFHGLTVPPVCHQDEVLRTSVQPGDPPFEYRLRIPRDEPPGLYWYHPHIHGFSSLQVLGGASGALVVEGIERAYRQLAGLPERVLVIRDQDLVNPDASPSRSEPVVPKMMIDRDGDAANNGTGFGKPAKDLSVNAVPVPFPDYPPARMAVRPGEQQLWRVLNASAVTYLNLALLFGRTPQPLGIVALDGVPLNTAGERAGGIQWRDHLGIPPGGRVEFLMTTPPLQTPALLVTRTVDTGAGGENDPNRALVSVSASTDAPPLRAHLEAQPAALPAPTRPWLGDVRPVRVRHLYFSEELSDPSNPNSAVKFFITADGATPKAFDPAATEPDIVVHAGEVEDWVIENRSGELHAFHIHQLHFLLLEWSGQPVDEPFLRDTVNVPYFNGRTLQYPSVRLRMDFRDPDSVGTFVYHCHLLEHEDGGMMGTIRVEPPVAAAPQQDGAAH